MAKIEFVLIGARQDRRPWWFVMGNTIESREVWN